ncbi:dihydrofolate reductase family protein [Amycolatopsis sp. NPDC059657]|uniref:dihydrofolate reductase family protein n=1 Tax=Amycolatopsis sp. NPDC059657 TaxID=3346899 RepID=UPI00366C452F
MRKLIVTNIVSLDGYFEGSGGNVMALPMDGAFDAYNAERLRAADTLLLGRRTFEMFQGFWPAVADNPAFGPVQQEISRLDNAIDKLVVSDSLGLEPTGAWTDTTEVIARAKAHAHIADLKRGDGGDILVFGSHTLWNDLLAADLVDELHLIIGAIALGGGTPAFTTANSLRLTGTRTFDGSDNHLAQFAK